MLLVFDIAEDGTVVVRDPRMPFDREGLGISNEETEA